MSRDDTVETEVNLITFPGSCPLEGRVFTFSSPVFVTVPGASVQEGNERVITDTHSDDHVVSININEMIPCPVRNSVVSAKIVMKSLVSSSSLCRFRIDVIKDSGVSHGSFSSPSSHSSPESAFTQTY